MGRREALTKGKGFKSGVCSGEGIIPAASYV